MARSISPRLIIENSAGGSNDIGGVYGKLTPIAEDLQ